jgi:hypothetical protein
MTVTGVPWWYTTIAHVLAIALSVWTGLHYRAPEWMALYGVAALGSAILPGRKLLGAIGLVTGLVVAGTGAYLMRDVRHGIVLGDLFAGGPIITPTREAVVLVLTTMWLLAASPLRFRWS